MAKQQFLENVRTAAGLLVPPFRSNGSGVDTKEIEAHLGRAAIWLTPSAVKGFSIRLAGRSNTV